MWAYNPLVFRIISVVHLVGASPVSCFPLIFPITIVRSIPPGYRFIYEHKEFHHTFLMTIVDSLHLLSILKSFLQAQKYSHLFLSVFFNTQISTMEKTSVSIFTFFLMQLLYFQIMFYHCTFETFSFPSYFTFGSSFVL